MLHENLKKLRKSCGFRQEEVAKVLGIDRSAYSYYESGKTEPSVKNLIKISRMFKVDVDALIGNSEYAAALALNSEPADEYDSQLCADFDSLGKCSSQERILVAMLRQAQDKEAFISAVKAQYDAETE
ncbi:MAG: helix-turn-helix transcriptional regulator [Clostridia bacterium]|nr:helix-turn-helix transcriptional regulator [Clostridia bacterium]